MTKLTGESRYNGSTFSGNPPETNIFDSFHLFSLVLKLALIALKRWNFFVPQDPLERDLNVRWICDCALSSHLSKWHSLSFSSTFLIHENPTGTRLCRISSYLGHNVLSKRWRKWDSHKKEKKTIVFKTTSLVFLNVMFSFLFFFLFRLRFFFNDD